MEETVTHFIYEFIFEDKSIIKYKVDLHKKVEDDEFDETLPESYKKFTSLDNNKCSNCPLNTKDSPECPVAKRIFKIVEDFRHHSSFDKVKVKATSDVRVYEKETDLQHGIQSFLGLAMGTSSCPHFQFLRPMGLLHLPFATNLETLARTVGFYLTKEYLKGMNFKEVTLEGLAQDYQKLNIVNRGLINRIRTFEKGDANQNALIILNSFADYFSLYYEHGLDDLHEFFGIPKPAR